MITKEMTIAQALEEKPDCGPVFMQFGMHCLGYAIAHGETVEQAAEVPRHRSGRAARRAQQGMKIIAGLGNPGRRVRLHVP